MPGQQPKIAICGAGPAGLTLARILLNNNIPVTIFEREASAQARQQGGTLDLHVETGQAAIKKADLWDEFQKYVRYEGEDMVMMDRYGKKYIEQVGEETGRPEIDRIRLRQILLESIPEGIIKWSHNLRRVEPGTLHFEHGTETGFDLIVGADGAWSKVRPLLTYITPFYSGISGIEIKLRDIDSKHPDLSKMVGNGSLFAWGEDDGRCLLCQRSGDGMVRVYAMGQKPENWIKEAGIDFDNADETRQKTLEDYSEWSSELKQLISRCDDDIIPRALYMLPVGLRWNSRSNITLIGDSAHLMTFFAGEGVNAAMDDAMHLAEAIIKQPGDIPNAIKEYETWMFPTAREKTQETWDNLLRFFEKGSLESFTAFMNEAMGRTQEEP